ncbi:MAG TPA: M20/M25/M40 family metallo-hydrolase [Bryobacteraceae bacterium]|nr:M20/M25/M40 family metallo-hydrolase [Bryobacteraceae bacterium]
MRFWIVFLAAIPAFAASTDQYRDTANKLIDAALADDAGLKRFEYLCYRIGNRLSGSASLDKAIAWSLDEMKSAGLANVRTVPTKVPHWVRGRESAEMLEPLAKPLYMLGLGNSIATPPEGITADVVSVSNFDELEKLGRRGVEGKIVLYDAPFVNYRETVAYRSNGASRAARLGAVAALVRSITPRSLRDPHTGAMQYAANDPKIPTAAVSVEDAIWIHRLTQEGQRVRIHLTMEAHFEPDADSGDVVGEIIGREKPNEVVAIGGHIDSWDVGQGAHDDGGGIMAALEAAALMKKMGLQPRRTIRVVFWTNEENGSRGGVAYRSWAAAQGTKHVAAIEMDGGAEKPIGFDLAFAKGRETAGFRERALSISELLKRIDAQKIQTGESEADVEPLMAQGVPVLALRTVMAHYWDYHHTQADTFDKIVPDEFRRCTAAFAVMSYVLADWP